MSEVSEVEGKEIEIEKDIEEVEMIAKKFSYALYELQALEANVYSKGGIEGVANAELELIDALVSELEDEMTEKGWDVEKEDLCDYCIAHFVKDKYTIHVWYDGNSLGITLEKNGEVLDSYYV